MSHRLTAQFREVLRRSHTRHRRRTSGRYVDESRHPSGYASLGWSGTPDCSIHTSYQTGRNSEKKKEKAHTNIHKNLPGTVHPISSSFILSSLDIASNVMNSYYEMLQLKAQHLHACRHRDKQARIKLMLVCLKSQQSTYKRTMVTRHAKSLQD